MVKYTPIQVDFAAESTISPALSRILSAFSKVFDVHDFADLRNLIVGLYLFSSAPTDQGFTISGYKSFHFIMLIVLTISFFFKLIHRITPRGLSRWYHNSMVALHVALLYITTLCLPLLQESEGTWASYIFSELLNGTSDPHTFGGTSTT